MQSVLLCLSSVLIYLQLQIIVLYVLCFSKRWKTTATAVRTLHGVPILDESWPDNPNSINPKSGERTSRCPETAWTILVILYARTVKARQLSERTRGCCEKGRCNNNPSKVVQRFGVGVEHFENSTKLNYWFFFSYWFPPFSVDCGHGLRVRFQSYKSHRGLKKVSRSNRDPWKRERFRMFQNTKVLLKKAKF